MFLDYGLLLIRIVLGLVLAAHGSQKLFGWFGGGGPQGTRQMIQSLNIHPTTFWAYANGLAEFWGGLLTAFGFLWPVGPILIFANLLVAIIKVHWSKGFFNTKGGYEFPLALAIVALAVAGMGAGIYSLDAWLNFALPEPKSVVYGLILALLGVAVALVSGSEFVLAPRHGVRHHRV